MIEYIKTTAKKGAKAMGNADLKNNIEHYMKVKGIAQYSQLHSMITHELGTKGEAAYEFAKRKKATFPKC